MSSAAEANEMAGALSKDASFGMARLILRGLIFLW